MTFSIVGIDQAEYKVGIAITSVFPAVGAVCPYVDNGVAVSSQSWDSGRTYGDPILHMVADDISLGTACDTVLKERAGASGTQLHGMTIDGDAFAYTGERSVEWAGHVIGDDHSVAGNMLTGKETIDSASNAFTNTDGTLEEKLLAALESGEDAGGDKRGDNLSAALLIKGPKSRLYHNLRVDEPGQPIRGLKKAYETAKETDANLGSSANEMWGENPPDSINNYEIKH
ncbi:DUF1028 domain-containing protein [Halorubraceae archaeon YAN]|nr:DUF1028 domain-containing protein [Halorubraceae archaeon YAN]